MVLLCLLLTVTFPSEFQHPYFRRDSLSKFYGIAEVVNQTSLWTSVTYMKKKLLTAERRVCTLGNYTRLKPIKIQDFILYPCISNRPFYSSVKCNQAFVWKWGSGWPWHDRDQKLVSIRTKAKRVCIKTRSTRASLPLKGLLSKHTTVKWPIRRLAIDLLERLSMTFVFPANLKNSTSAVCL